MSFKGKKYWVAIDEKGVMGRYCFLEKTKRLADEGAIRNAPYLLELTVTKVYKRSEEVKEVE